ncbi:MAG: hypothetical protein U0744_09260 [Gemmataceae bacterium]
MPSAIAPETPGSIHEGGELGLPRRAAYGAAFDNPDLIVACVVGDGEAETVLWPPAGREQIPQPARGSGVLPFFTSTATRSLTPVSLPASPRKSCRSFRRHGL